MKPDSDQDQARFTTLVHWGCAFHHTVYARATGLAFRLLDAASTRPAGG